MDLDVGKKVALANLAYWSGERVFVRVSPINSVDLTPGDLLALILDTTQFLKVVFIRAGNEALFTADTTVFLIR